MNYLGIDVGTSGAATLIDESGCIIDSIKFTETYTDIADAFAEYSKDHSPLCAYIEQVHSMPAQGVVSVFKFGTSFGFLLGLLTATKIPYELVTPQKWQKYLNCQTKGNKNITKQLAQQLYPNYKITHANADSILIAEYGRRINKLK